MSISTVKAGLDGVAQRIVQLRKQYTNGRDQILQAQNGLNRIPSQFTEVVTEVNGYTPTGPSETLAKDELAKLTAEFKALKADVEADLTALSITF